MKKITKREFNILHDNNKMSLIGNYPLYKETVARELKKYNINERRVTK